MSNDKTTLADVRPGGRVRLGDQAERARFEAWAHAQSYRGGNIMADRDAVHPDVYADPIAQLTWKSWQAALSAQPSPGGQDALKALDDLAAFCSDDTATVDRHVAVIRAALAARQPVGEEPDAYLVQAVKDGEAWEHRWYVPRWGDPNPSALDGTVYEIRGRKHPELGTYRVKPFYAAPPAQPPAQVYLDGLDRALGEAIDQRDRYHEVADDLAGHIAAITGVDIGEHSSANCPWRNAIEAAEEYKPTQAVDLERARDEGHDGAIRYVLGHLNGTGDCGSTAYDEILNACGRERIIRSAVEDGELEFTGLGRWVEMYGTAEDRALIDGKAVGNG